MMWAQARLNLRGGISEVSHSQTPFVHLHTQVDGAFQPKSFLSSCRGLGNHAKDHGCVASAGHIHFPAMCRVFL